MQKYSKATSFAIFMTIFILFGSIVQKASALTMTSQVKQTYSRSSSQSTYTTFSPDANGNPVIKTTFSSSGNPDYSSQSLTIVTDQPQNVSIQTTQEDPQVQVIELVIEDESNRVPCSSYNITDTCDKYEKETVCGDLILECTPDYCTKVYAFFDSVCIACTNKAQKVWFPDEKGNCK